MQVKVKRLLRFYFAADKMNKALDSELFRIAQRSAGDMYCQGEKYFEEAARVIGVKEELSALYARINDVMSRMSAEDIASLKRYAFFRGRLAGLPCAEQAELRRAKVKFLRHAARAIGGALGAYKYVNEYYFALNLP